MQADEGTGRTRSPASRVPISRTTLVYHFSIESGTRCSGGKMPGQRRFPQPTDTRTSRRCTTLQNQSGTPFLLVYQRKQPRVPVVPLFWKLTYARVRARARMRIGVTINGGASGTLLPIFIDLSIKKRVLTVPFRRKNVPLCSKNVPLSRFGASKVVRFGPQTGLRARFLPLRSLPRRARQRTSGERPLLLAALPSRAEHQGRAGSAAHAYAHRPCRRTHSRRSLTRAPQHARHSDDQEGSTNDETPRHRASGSSLSQRSDEPDWPCCALAASSASS